MRYQGVTRGPGTFFLAAGALTLVLVSTSDETGGALAQPPSGLTINRPLVQYIQGKVYAGAELAPGLERGDPGYEDILSSRVVLGRSDLYPVAPMNMVRVNLLRASDDTVIDSIDVVDGGVYAVESRYIFNGTGPFRLEVRDLLSEEQLLLSEPLTATAAVTVRYLLVPGEPLEMGPVETSSGIGSAEFTEVGSVEVRYLTEDVAGFATVPPLRATELRIPAYKQAPFGGTLRFFGSFHRDFHPDSVASMKDDYCYTVEIDDLALSRELKKTRITYTLAGDKVYESIVMGPYTAFPDTDFEVQNCYGLTPLEFLDAHWTFGNLLAIWSSSLAADGPHEVTLRLHGSDGAVADATLPVHVDNQWPEVHIDDVYVDGDSVDGSCELLDLSDGSPLTLEYTLRHPNPGAGPEDFLYRYWVGKLSNSGSEFLKNEVYEGTPIDVAEETLTVEWDGDVNCAYIFRVYAKSRTTNGYHRFRWRYDEQSFYVLVPLS